MGLKPHFPVVLIPGIISSGLESWGTSEKSLKFFRKRMWGTTSKFIVKVIICLYTNPPKKKR